MTDHADKLDAPTPPPPEASRREEDKPTIFLGSSIFEAMLFSLRVLTANDKRKMTEAIEKGITPPEGDLAGFYTVYRHATEEEKEKMLDAIRVEPPKNPPVPDADAANNRAILTLLRLMAKPSRDHIAAALDSGLDSLTKEELFAHGQLVAMVTCTEGEHDSEIADVLGISIDRIAALRARELATPPEQEDFFRDPVTQKKEEARRKIRRVFPISQTAGYNALLSITKKNSDNVHGEKKTVTKNGKEIDIVSVTLTKKNRRGETKLTLEKKREKDAAIEEQYQAAAACWRTSAKKMLDYAVIKLTEKNQHIKRGSTVDIREIDTLVSWSLEEWCTLRGKPTTESSIEHVRVDSKEDCETLVGTHFAWSTRGKGGFKQFTFMNPLQMAEVKGGQITIRLAQDFSRYLLEAPVSPYRRKMLSTDERNPNAYALARKLGDFANIKDNSDRRKKIPIENQYKISISALMECTSIPKPEAVANGNYRILIVNPFIVAMEEAERVLDIEWGFVLPIEESQIIDKIPPKRIEDFMAAYIVYSFKDCETAKDTAKP